MKSDGLTTALWKPCTRLSRILGILLTTASVIAGCSCGPGSISPTDIPIDSPGLTGRVIDAESREGLPDATVSIQGSTARTSSYGQYRIVPLQKGPSLVVVTHPGYADVRQTVTITGMVNTANGDWTDSADFEMHPQK